MTDSDAPQALAGNSWDAYWQETAGANMPASLGGNFLELEAVWSRLFSGAQQRFKKPALLDIATGDGALLSSARSVFGAEGADFNCVDVSAAAISIIHERFPGVTGTVADGRRTSLVSGAYDLVTSQFGIEYAGPEAFAEAARLVATDGELVLVLHHDKGVVFEESVQKLEALRLLKRSEFIDAASKMLRLGFAAAQGGDRQPYESAAKILSVAVGEMEQIMLQYGQHAADDIVMHLYDRVAHIHENLLRYDSDEVCDWLERMRLEIESYGQRLVSMCESAISQARLEELCQQYRRLGFEIVKADALLREVDSRPLSWLLIAKKGQITASLQKVADELIKPSSIAPESADPSASRAQVQSWVDTTKDATINELTATGKVKELFFEATVVWILPFECLIGRLRKPQSTDDAGWFIGGQLGPVDYISAAAATTPRSAARYFAYKWQLDAEHIDDIHKSPLVEAAQLLYALSEDDRLWSR
jgi:SAM-dependent methyltransferase